MENLGEYVLMHTECGECKCGSCCDNLGKPDPQGHTVDMIFVTVCAKDEPDQSTLAKLAREHVGEFGDVDIFDGTEHGYIELGGWLGDQGIALRFMGLCCLLGGFDLLTPKTVLPPGLNADMVMQLAQSGMVTIKAKPPTPAPEGE